MKIRFEKNVIRQPSAKFLSNFNIAKNTKKKNPQKTPRIPADRLPDRLHLPAEESVLPGEEEAEVRQRRRRQRRLHGREGLDRRRAAGECEGRPRGRGGQRGGGRVRGGRQVRERQD